MSHRKGKALMTQPPHTLLGEIAAIQKMNANQILAKYARLPAPHGDSVHFVFDQ